MVISASDSRYNDAGSFDLISPQVPSLRRLTIVASIPSYSFKATVVHIALRILNITVFEKHQLSSCPTLLAVFQNLSTLHLDGHLPFRPLPSSQFVVHDRLTALIVCSDALEALKYFTFPALRHLVFTPRPEQPLPLTAIADEQFLLSFMARSQCSLNFLALHWLSFTHQGLSKVLHLLPHPEVLKTLTLSSPSLLRHLNYKWDDVSGALDTPDLLLLPEIEHILACGQQGYTTDDSKLLTRYWNTRCVQLNACQSLRASPWPPVALALFPPLGGSFEQPLMFSPGVVQTLPDEDVNVDEEGAPCRRLCLTVLDLGGPFSHVEDAMCAPLYLSNLDGQAWR
jgi:hypothetical protein